MGKSISETRILKYSVKALQYPDGTPV